MEDHAAGFRRPGPLVPLTRVGAESSRFQVYRGVEPPRFQNDAELQCAKVFDFYGVPWEYEPRTFVLETDAEGRVMEAFKPDFYLPEQDLYLEITVSRNFDRSFEDMMKEIRHLIDQMTEEERAAYMVESLFLNAVKYENDRADAYMRKLSSKK